MIEISYLDNTPESKRERIYVKEGEDINAWKEILRQAGAKSLKVTVNKGNNIDIKV